MFETAPLLNAVRVVGRILVKLFVTTNAPTLDLWVKLLDVAPDGTAWNLMSPGLDAVRIGHRPPGDGPLRSDRVYPVVLDRLITANHFWPGHRVRIVVMTSFMPHFSRNPQTGVWGTETNTTRPARVKIKFGLRHRSRIELPVLSLKE